MTKQITFRRFLIGGALALSVFLVVPRDVALAHTILPADLQQFIHTHPNATIEEIQQWIDEQNNLLHATSSAQELVTAAAEQKGFWANAFKFIKLGMEHIFTGTDHILFLIAMMLTYVTIKDIFKLTGTFTLAHSVTLILSGTLLFSISSHIVEPIIAFSIAYVAVATVFLRRGTREKLATVFLFGLVHGMGFAGALMDIQIPQNKFLSSLLFFNAGIEVGQLLIIGLAIAPILYLMRKTPWHERIVQVIAVLIALIGIYWGVERIIV
jgi:hypothetical protein